jgi:hypothetical protein
MSLDRNYRAARRVLSSPSARFLAAIEAGKVADAAARASVRRDIEAGADARALYEAETDKARRVALVGYLRRGMAALS